MKTKYENVIINELDTLCEFVRKHVTEKNYDVCISVICQAMEDHPHAPHPHNLLGIVMEKLGDHSSAMKHFRAAWALDPTYSPAHHNLNTYGTFFSHGHCAYNESDVPCNTESSIEIVYDERGIGRAVSKNKVQYDEHGIGRIIRR